MLLEELQRAFTLNFWKVDDGLPVVPVTDYRGSSLFLGHTVRRGRRDFYFKCLSGNSQSNMVSTDIFGDNRARSDHRVFAYTRPGKQCRMIRNSGSVTDPGHEVGDLFYIVNVM